MRRPRKQLISNKVLISIFISFIMVTSIMGFIIGSFRTAEEELEYKNLLFTKSGNYWETEINDMKIRTTYFPSELEDINVSEDALSKLKSTKMIYITTPVQGPNLDAISLASFELADFLTPFQIFSQAAISDNNTGYALPLITCQNATLFVPVISIENANQTQAYLEGDCIILEAQYAQDFIRLKDKIILKFVGIM